MLKKIYLITKLLIVLIALNLYSIHAADHCIPNDHIVPKSKVVTGKGWTPQEAMNNFYSKLPQVGVLQTLSFKKTKVRTENSYSETALATQDIFANFDYVTRYNCRNNGSYMVSAIVPTHKINYYPTRYDLHEYLTDDDDTDSIALRKYFNFAKAKRFCGDKEYTFVLGNHTFNPRVKYGRFASNKVIGFWRAIVLCGRDWQLQWRNEPKRVSDSHVYTLNPSEYQNNWYYAYSHTKIDDFGKYMRLQMISNAMKGR